MGGDCWGGGVAQTGGFVDEGKGGFWRLWVKIVFVFVFVFVVARAVGAPICYVPYLRAVLGVRRVRRKGVGGA